MPSSSPTCMLSSDPDLRGLPTVLFCFWYQDILNTPSHSSSCHFTNPLRSVHFLTISFISSRQSQEDTLSLSCGLHSIRFFLVSYMLDLYGGLDHIPLVLRWIFWTSPPTPKRTVSFFTSYHPAHLHVLLVEIVSCLAEFNWIIKRDGFCWRW